MTNLTGPGVLAINTGSSSLKAALFRGDGKPALVVSAEADRIGHPGSRLRIADGRGAMLFERQAELPDHEAALEATFDWLRKQGLHEPMHSVGHRVVHGGSRYSEPQRVTPELLAALDEWRRVVPDHLPQAISGIESARKAFPAAMQVACFDTAFHSRMPRLSSLYALPRHFHDEGLKRFGFHGLSYEYVIGEVGRLDGALADGRVIVAHLGNGASMAAILRRASVDTTMGFTPASGLVMGTRAGDIDPEAILHLLGERGMTAAEVTTLLNRQSGLLGVSGTSGNMQDLLEAETTDPHAAEAIALYCYRARKYLGAYASALGGLDMLVFTGGIGTHAAAIRERICSGQEFLGIALDPARNRDNAPVISAPGSPVKVRVVKTDEERVIAGHCLALLGRIEEGAT